MTPWGHVGQMPDRPELPLYRLYVLRAAYLLLGLGQGAKTWPAILHHTQVWDFWHGVGTSFFGALTLLSLLGVICGKRWIGRPRGLLIGGVGVLERCDGAVSGAGDAAELRGGGGQGMNLARAAPIGPADRGALFRDRLAPA